MNDGVICFVKASYSGHTDFVHCVCMRNGSSQFVSGAEDGTVRIWGELLMDLIGISHNGC